MRGNDSNKELEQLSLWDVLQMADSPGVELSSEDLEAAIVKLQEWKSCAKRREKKEKEKHEREEAERKAREEKERKEAHIQEVTCMDLPLDWNNVFNFDVRTQGVHTDSIPDALIISLATLGKVDIEFISSITGADYKTVISTLKGSIYQNPDTWGECFYKGWETAEEYLSGNLMRKWNVAKDANKEYNGYFSENIKAIEKILPPTVATKDIYITLGSPWVPADIIDDFILHLFGDPFKHGWSCHNRDEIPELWKTIHDEITGTWEIPYKSRYNHSIGVSKTYGTAKMEDELLALEVIGVDAVGSQRGEVGGQHSGGQGDDEAVEHTPGDVDGGVVPGIFQIDEEVLLGQEGEAGGKLGVGAGGVDDHEVEEEQTQEDQEDQNGVDDHPQDRQLDLALGVVAERTHITSPFLLRCCR